MVRVGGFFSGIGAHHSACMRAGIPGVEFQVKWQCDIDPYKVDAYNRMHGEVPNLGDISEVRDLDGEREIDLLFYTPSCQNISAAGRKEGNTEGSGTSSSLVFEVPRILAATKARPSVLIMEEVPMMVAKRFKANFDIILERLSELGYRHSWKVVNATDFGVGQNRKRLICVSVLGREPPVFPEPKGSFRPLRDYLEPHGAVPDSYFLTEERLKGVIWSSDKESGRGNGFRFQPCPPPTTGLQAQSTQSTDGRQTHTSLQIGMLMTYGLEMHNRVWSIDHASPTVTAAQGGGTMTKIAVPEGRTPVRELTPRECLRLMGFLDEEIDRIIGSYSKTRLRMFAGDAVVVDMFVGVLGSIYGEVADDAC